MRSREGLSCGVRLAESGEFGPVRLLAAALPPDTTSDGAGALWIGAVRDFDASALETPFTSTFTHNGGAPITGRSTNVKGGPLGAAREFLMLARRYGLPVLPGQWIATGGLNPAVAVTPGDQVGFAALGDQVSVAFT